MKYGGFKNRILPYLAVVLGFAVLAGAVGYAGIKGLDSVTVRLAEASAERKARAEQPEETPDTELLTLPEPSQTPSETGPSPLSWSTRTDRS